jgi:Cobalamin synthesis protein cobW C-terminal domain
MGLGHPPETEQYGISSFVYRAPRPFHPLRLWATVLEGGRAPAPAGALSGDREDAHADGNPGAAAPAGLPHVLRSKGFFWLATRPDLVWEWSTVGENKRFKPYGCWMHPQEPPPKQEPAQPKREPAQPIQEPAVPKQEPSLPKQQPAPPRVGSAGVPQSAPHARDVQPGSSQVSEGGGAQGGSSAGPQGCGGGDRGTVGDEVFLREGHRGSVGDQGRLDPESRSPSVPPAGAVAGADGNGDQNGATSGTHDGPVGQEEIGGARFGSAGGIRDRSTQGELAAALDVPAKRRGETSTREEVGDAIDVPAKRRKDGGSEAGIGAGKEVVDEAGEAGMLEAGRESAAGAGDCQQRIVFIGVALEKVCWPASLAAVPLWPLFCPVWFQVLRIKMWYACRTSSRTRAPL